MKQGWVVERLDEVCEVNYGTRVVKKRDGGKIFPVYGGGGATFFMDTYNREDCLVISRFGMSAQCTRFVKGKFFLNDSGLTVRPKEKSNLRQDFLNLQMISLNDQIYSLSRGAAQRNLDVPAFRIIKITYPISLPEQQRIVSILDKVFATIDKAKVNAELNLKNAHEVFDSYLQGVFEEKGDGWELKKLGDVCHFVRGPFGGSLKKNIFKSDGFAVYEQKHAIYDQFNDVRYFVDENKFNEMKRFELKSGDLIMSCSGTIGKVALVPDLIRKGIINQALLKISTRKEILNLYLKIWMESNNFRKSIKIHSGGAAIQNVASVSILKNILIPLPSIEEQQSIVNKIDTLRAETQKLEAIYQKKLDSLEELKKSVLQKAFAGELIEDV